MQPSDPTLATDSFEAAQPAIDADVFWKTLVAAASAGYREVDGHAYRFARAKLGGDRVFRHILATGLIVPGARVVDIGCGQGLLASLLRAAGEASQRGHWPAGWAQAPRGAHVTGIDPLALDIERGVAALGDAATFVCADMRSFQCPPCDTAVFLDTLHYIRPHEQDEVLERVGRALRPGGTVLLRVGDAAARGRFRLGLWIDRWTMKLRGFGAGPLAGRPLAGWRSSLERLGFRVESLPMNGRPPFANLLIVARLPTSESPRAESRMAAPSDQATGGGTPDPRGR